ncbi:SRPBCC family protein [Ornithinibacillus sp. 179-J 7C1 HS]|uniref:SRPBCC family protein n=1 Tax=Ornithinibacillus sp. 179-J 7C1 HS TaxID=3142384 RepID=UPI00399F933F
MTTTTNNKAIKKEITIKASLNLAWLAWTISERVSEWFAPEVIVEAKVGGAFELYFIPGNKSSMNTKGCTITKLIHEKELHFTWRGPDEFEALMNNENELTTVKVYFESINDHSTKVLVEHDGFKNHPKWNEAINWHNVAWSGVLDSLKSALEKGEGNLCCQP